MNNYKAINVFWDEKKVGTLATAKNHVVAFEYDDQWLNMGFSSVPFRCRWKRKYFF